MEKSIWMAAVVTLGMGTAGWAQGGAEAAVQPEVERGVHPLYGAPEPQILKPEEIEMKPELFPGNLRAGETIGAWSLLDQTVFRENDQALGRVEDLVIDFKNGRVAYLLIRPEVDFGEEAQVDYAVSVDALTVKSGYLFTTESTQEAERSPILTDAGVAALVGGPGEKLPGIVLVEREVAIAPQEYGQSSPARETEMEPKREPEVVQPKEPKREPVETEVKETRVPIEVRGGVPPEHRGGVPPEARTPVDGGIGLKPAGPTGKEKNVEKVDQER